MKSKRVTTERVQCGLCTLWS